MDNTTSSQNTSPNTKSKKGLIAALAGVAVVAIGGTATALVLMNNQGTPGEIVLDAVTKTIKSESNTFAGSISADSASTGSIKVELDGKSRGLNNDASVAVSMSSDSIGNYSLRLHEIFQDDGTLYFNTSELADVVGSLISNFGSLLQGSVSTLADNVKTLAGKIDASWWKLSAKDLLEEFSADEDASKTVDCVLSATKDLVGSAGLEKVANLYKENPFITAAKSDFKPESFQHNSYETTIDREKLVDFLNQYISSDDVKKIGQCSSDGVEVTVRDLDSDEIPDLSDYKFYLDIDGGHNLKGLYATTTVKEVPVTIDFRLDDKDVTIEAPAESRPATELFEDAMNIGGSALTVFSSDLYD